LIGNSRRGKAGGPLEENKIVLWTALRFAAGVVVTAGVVAAADPVLAQGRLDARYAVSLSGVPVGKGAWVIDIAENQFTAAASGATAGLLRVFASGQGSGRLARLHRRRQSGAGELRRQHHLRQEDRRNPHDARRRRRQGIRHQPRVPTTPSACR
jgi:hypothetical protein